MSKTTITAQNVMDAVKSDSSDLSDSIRSEYNGAEVSVKAAIRKVVQDAMIAAVVALDADLANSIRLFGESLKSVSSHKVEIDPKARYAEYVASVGAFWADVMSGQHVPDGLELSDSDKESVLSEVPEMSWDAMDELADSDILAKLGKVRGSAVVRRSVTDHLIEVFSDLPVGTFLTNTQAANRTSEAYGTDHPSSGAVAASKNLPAGLVRIDPSKGQKGGIRKVA
jgi:hypothetical protein